MAPTTVEEPPEAKKEPPEEETSASAADLCMWPPAVVERYVPLEKLCNGMSGDVYKAWDRAGKRLVAVKRFSGGAGERFVVETAGPRDFAREAASLAACRGHPSVVELVTTHAADPDTTAPGYGDCFVVTRFAGPLNLRQYMRLRSAQGRPFREREVRRAMRQLLAGATHVHAAGFLHRDVAPENVVVAERSGRRRAAAYRICGFGASEPAARAVGADDDSGLGMLAAAGPYRAPEVFLGSGDYDGRVDTWGLGCVMAELLAGGDAPFFAAGSELEAFNKMLRVVGTKGVVEWPGLQRLPEAGDGVVAKLRDQGYAEYAGCLRKTFPEEVLSEAGFEVLSGLLEGNPEKRLTAEAALGMPWFRRRRRFGGCCLVP